MNARYLNIESKQRPELGISNVNDFVFSEGEEVNSEIIVQDPNLSLYCFDDEEKEAIFVELPSEIDLTTVPFVYATQCEEAKRLVTVPYDTFLKITESLPPVKHLILTYISGRSGSTLLSHIFNEVDGVMSLSEPDVITQFMHLRGDDHARDVELRKLLDATVRILFKPTPHNQPKIYALKYRMETLCIMDLFQETFPHAKNLYLYRDCAGFVASFYRIAISYGMTADIPLAEFITRHKNVLRYDFTSMTENYLDTDTNHLSVIQLFTLFWLVGVEWYLDQASTDIPILPVRYADFNAHREEVLAAIFKYCDLPVERASQPFKSFEHDSQAGTPLAGHQNAEDGKRLQLTAEQIQEIDHILKQHPVINHSDFIVPNTLKV